MTALERDEGNAATQPGRGDYFRFAVQGTKGWQYFHRPSKAWRRVENVEVDGGESLVLRDGWIVRVFSRSQGAAAYYTCVERELRPLARGEAELTAWGAKEVSTVLSVATRGELVYVHTAPVALPLSAVDRLRPLAAHTTGTRHRPDVLVFTKPNWAEARAVLRAIGVETEERLDFTGPSAVLGEAERVAYRELVKLVSDVLTFAYSDYLKAEDRIERFILDVAHRAWEHIPSVELRERLESLTQQADAGNLLAKSLVVYLLDKLPLWFDWSTMSGEPELECLIVDGTPLEFQDKWSTNYYRIVVPALECSLHWRTTLAPDGRGPGEASAKQSRLTGLRISKWRVYPYLGKMKLTGNRARGDVAFERLQPGRIHEMLTSIPGILSVEAYLRETAHVEGFNLDYREWRGSYGFNRTFFTAVRIVKALEDDAPLPTTLVQDAFGATFRIEWDFENYEHELERIRSFGSGGWITVVLESDLLQLGEDRDIPVFKTVQRLGPRFVTPDEAYEVAALALVKYVGMLSDDGFNFATRLVAEPERLMNAMRKLENEGRVVREQRHRFYAHEPLSPAQARQIATMTLNAERSVQPAMLRTSWYARWSMLRAIYPYLHPLTWSEGLVNARLRHAYPPDETLAASIAMFAKGEVAALEELRARLRRQRMSVIIRTHGDYEFNETFVGEREVDRYVNHAAMMLHIFGLATIKARGRWITKAHEVAQSVLQRHAYASPKIVRRDSLERNLHGRTVPAVEFDLQTFGT